MQWWLISRAAGFTALLAMSASVILGLMLATRAIPRASVRAAAAAHEHLAIVTLVAMAVHGEALLGDRWLDPGVLGIGVPFVMDYRPAFTAAGIVAGWLAVALGLSYYARRRIGARRWRSAHRFIAVAWLLAMVHTLGAGSDAGHPVVVAFAGASGGVVAALLAVRLLTPRRTQPESGRQDAPAVP